MNDVETKAVSFWFNRHVNDDFYNANIVGFSYLFMHLSSKTPKKESQVFQSTYKVYFFLKLKLLRHSSEK